MYDKGKEAVVYFSMSIKMYLNLPLHVATYIVQNIRTWEKNKLHMLLKTVSFYNDVSFTISKYACYPHITVTVTY